MVYRRSSASLLFYGAFVCFLCYGVIWSVKQAMSAPFANVGWLIFGLVVFLLALLLGRRLYGCGRVEVTRHGVRIHNIFGRELVSLTAKEIGSKVVREFEGEYGTTYQLILETPSGPVRVNSDGMKNFHAMVNRIPNQKRKSKHLRQREEARDNQHWRLGFYAFGSVLLLVGIQWAATPYRPVSAAQVQVIDVPVSRIEIDAYKKQLPDITFFSPDLAGYRAEVNTLALYTNEHRDLGSKLTYCGDIRLAFSRDEYQGKVGGKAASLTWWQKHWGYTELTVLYFYHKGVRYGSLDHLNDTYADRNASNGPYYTLGIGLLILLGVRYLWPKD